MNPEASFQMMALLHIFGKLLEVHLGLTILQMNSRFVIRRCVCIRLYRSDKACITYLARCLLNPLKREFNLIMHKN
jgi:hypothetical protein